MKRYKAGSDEEITSEETERETKDSLQEKSLSDEESATPLAEVESQDVAENAVAQEEAEQSHMLAVQDDEIEDIPEVADEEEVRDQPRRRNFSWPTREQVFAWAPFIGVVLLGAILRFWGLGDKPLHHDESLHAYFSLQLMHNMENWAACFNQTMICYRYDPLLHGPFQFHAIALVYKISQLLGAPDHGVNTTTVRIAAATLGTLIVGLPYFLRDYLGRVGAWLACFLLAVSPSMVYYSRFAREDIYMACFTLLLVVGVARYLRSRKIGALILAAVAFALSYATKEATFLTIGIFGSFFGALIVWELGLRWPWRSRVASDAAFVRYIPKTMAPLAVFLYFLILAPFA
ncbi:MAG TPA: flippase activity-associated protein Agl23, partial [Ktedonobacteraceae bacterium]|nr:flippase activity-associated protein Agl23 [Ktedonobacteraceae bacterium]